MVRRETYHAWCCDITYRNVGIGKRGMRSNTQVATLLLGGLAFNYGRKRIVRTDSKVATLLGKKTTLAFSAFSLDLPRQKN